MSFAMRIASASSSKGISAATGPKTSSRAIRSSFVASTIVHGYQKPLPCGASPRVERLAVDEARDGLAVLRGDQRAHLGRLVAGSPTFTLRGRGDEQVGEAVVGAALDEDARARAAVLAGVVEDGVRRGGRGLLEVGVGEDDVRGLAAELERDALDRRGGAFHHGAADLGRAGEADLRDVGMLDEALADDRALADDDVEHALGDPGLERELGEPERGERRQLRRLEHDGVAAGERGAELPRRDVEREVPRDDQPDDAERLAERHVDAARDGDRLAVLLVDGAGVEVEDVGDHADLAARAGDRLADVLRLDPRELFVVLLDERREPAQQPAAVGGRDGPPGGKRRPCPRDGRVGLVDPSLLEGRDRLLGRRVENGETHAPDLTTSQAVVWRRAVASEGRVSRGRGPGMRTSALRGPRRRSARAGADREVKRTRMFEPDRGAIAAPRPSRRAVCAALSCRRVQIDVAAGDPGGPLPSVSSRAKNACLKRWPCARLSIHRMNPACEAAVQLPHALRQPAIGEADDEVVVVLHQGPVDGVSSRTCELCARTSGERSRAVRRVEERAAVTASRADVVVARRG